MSTVIEIARVAFASLRARKSLWIIAAVMGVILAVLWAGEGPASPAAAREALDTSAAIGGFCFFVAVIVFGAGALPGERDNGTLPLLLLRASPAQIMAGKVIGTAAFAATAATVATLALAMAMLANGVTVNPLLIVSGLESALSLTLAGAFAVVLGWRLGTTTTVIIATAIMMLSTPLRDLLERHDLTAFATVVELLLPGRRPPGFPDALGESAAPTWPLIGAHLMTLALYPVILVLAASWLVDRQTSSRRRP